MSTFAERVEAISGVETSDITEGLLNTWLSESAKEVINILPPQVLYKASVQEEYFQTPPEVDADGNIQYRENYDNIGTSVPESRILNVVRWTQKVGPDTDGDGTGDGLVDDIPYECIEIDAALRGRTYKDSGYMEEATQENPVFYRLNEKVYINPVPVKLLNVNTRAEISYVTYPDIEHDGSSIDNFPVEVEHLVILKTAVKAKFWQIAQANKEEDLEVAASHTNHMSALNQEYTMCLQNYLGGFQINIKEQGVA